jgi:hypothetical protein
MGVFYKTDIGTPVFKSALKTALKTQPSKVKNLDQRAAAMALEAQTQTPKTQFLWARFVLAVLILVALGGLGIWSSTKPPLDAWSKMFLHCFEIMFGGVMGILGVESVTK